MEKCLNEATSNNRELINLEELCKRKDAVFSKQQIHIELLATIDSVDTYEKQEIFNTKVIGKEDVDIADLISRLNISDWVQQGHKHSKETDGICPFCQQKLPQNFNEKISEYFNDTYTNQLKELGLISKQYRKFFDDLFEELKALEYYKNQYFEYEKVSPIIQLIESQYNENKALIEQKQKSLVVLLLLNLCNHMLIR